MNSYIRDSLDYGQARDQ